jgi:hypothetical protein
MTGPNRPGGSHWLTPGRAIGLAVFVLALFHPLTRVIALGYGIGWSIVECVRAARRASKSTDNGGNQR